MKTFSTLPLKNVRPKPQNCFVPKSKKIHSLKPAPDSVSRELLSYQPWFPAPVSEPNKVRTWAGASRKRRECSVPGLAG